MATDTTSVTDATEAVARAIVEFQKSWADRRIGLVDSHTWDLAMARAAIAAYHAHLEAEGKVVVPREPTREMAEYAIAACNAFPVEADISGPTEVWRAMIAAGEGE